MDKSPITNAFALTVYDDVDQHISQEIIAANTWQQAVRRSIALDGHQLENLPLCSQMILRAAELNLRVIITPLTLENPYDQRT
jgi:hypothetical protein